MVEMINENHSEYVFLNKDTNSKFRFFRNNKSENYSIMFYSSRYQETKSLGTVDKEIVCDALRRSEIQQIIEVIYELANDEQLFIMKCKSIYGKRLRTESFDVKITLEEKQKLNECLAKLREEN